MKNRYAHISIDDVTIALQRLSSREYTSIFEDKLFRILRMLHKLYGLKITLYVYARHGQWSLADVPNKYQQEFVEASEWLKFGFHAVSDNQRPDEIMADFEDQYRWTNQQIVRFAGTQSIAKILRLHYWYYPKEYTTTLREDEIIALLVKNDNEKKSINGISTLKTNLRIEQDTIWNICNYKNTNEPIVVFTHEWALRKKNIFKLAMAIFIIRLRGYNFICE